MDVHQEKVFNVYDLNYNQQIICTVETMPELRKWYNENKYGVAGSKGDIIGRHYFKYETRKHNVEIINNTS